MRLSLSRKTRLYTVRCTALKTNDGPMPQLGSYPSLKAALEAIEDFKKRHQHLAEVSLVLHGVQIVDPSGTVVWDGQRREANKARRKRPPKATPTNPPHFPEY